MWAGDPAGLCLEGPGALTPRPAQAPSQPQSSQAPSTPHRGPRTPAFHPSRALFPQHCGRGLEGRQVPRRPFVQGPVSITPVARLSQRCGQGLRPEPPTFHLGAPLVSLGRGPGGSCRVLRSDDRASDDTGSQPEGSRTRAPSSCSPSSRRASRLGPGETGLWGEALLQGVCSVGAGWGACSPDPQWPARARAGPAVW